MNQPSLTGLRADDEAVVYCTLYWGTVRASFQLSISGEESVCARVSRLPQDASHPPKLLGTVTLSLADVERLDDYVAFYRHKPRELHGTFSSLLDVHWRRAGELVGRETFFDNCSEADHFHGLQVIHRVLADAIFHGHTLSGLHRHDVAEAEVQWRSCGCFHSFDYQLKFSGHPLSADVVRLRGPEDPAQEQIGSLQFSERDLPRLDQLLAFYRFHDGFGASTTCDSIRINWQLEGQTICAESLVTRTLPTRELGGLLTFDEMLTRLEDGGAVRSNAPPSGL